METSALVLALLCCSVPTCRGYQEEVEGYLVTSSSLAPATQDTEAMVDTGDMEAGARSELAASRQVLTQSYQGALLARDLKHFKQVVFFVPT